jgi:DNA-binding CsgD family transcriptional regulator/tetratricopeptide (TPR) repeat protein
MIPTMPRVSSPFFVGRAAEIGRLTQALELARDHRPAARLIAGEAGIGKTRLVNEFAGQARAAGAQVLLGGCLQLGETGLPYAPFVGALRPLLRSLPPERLAEVIGPGRGELARLLPDLGPPDRHAATRPDASLSGTAAQARLFEIILGLLRRLSDERPVVVILEDIHWADASTRDLLRFLVRNLREARVLFVATYRSDEMHRRHPLRPLLAELERLASVDDIELGAFGHEDLAEQLAGITGERAAPELVDAVLVRSGGNPFFAEELMAAGRAGLALPRSLRDTLDDRVRHLDEEAQQVLKIASVAGERVDHRLLAAVVEPSGIDLLEAIRQAVEHHLLVPSAPDQPPGYAFRHALVQEAVYEDLLPSERTQLHAAYAQAIETQPELTPGDPSASAALLAHHWFMAHDLERALPASLEAARAAASGFAFAEAQAFLERALELWPKVPASVLPTGVDRTVLLEEAAEAAVQCGDPRRSIDLIREALTETDPVADPMRAGVLQHRLAWYFNEAGDWQAGVVALERAVDQIPIDPPTNERARVVSDLAHSLMVRGRFSDSLGVAEAALAISRTVGAQIAEARALNALGLDLASRSDFERGLPILREGHAKAVALGDPLAVYLTAVGLGWVLDEMARHAESLELAIATIDHLRDLGAEARFGGQIASKASRALFDLGRWDEAAVMIDEAIASNPTRYAMRWLFSNRIRLRVARGDFDGARADFDAYHSLGERVVSADPDLLHARRADLAIAAGEPLVAREIVRDTFAHVIEPEVDTDGRALLMIGLWAEADEVASARAARSRARVAAAVTRVAELEADLDRYMSRVGEMVARRSPVIEADALLAAALAQRARGTDDPGSWEAAVAARRALARPWELAVVLAQAAEVYLTKRHREDGAAALAEAHAIAVDLGAAPLRSRTEALARRARIGLEGVDTADDAADRLGLTRREREVLELLASGRSNRQIGEQLFMAESTAGVHVSNILGKLGVSRRHEAAAVAHRIGLRLG